MQQDLPKRHQNHKPLRPMMVTQQSLTGPEDGTFIQNILILKPSKKFPNIEWSFPSMISNHTVSRTGSHPQPLSSARFRLEETPPSGTMPSSEAISTAWLSTISHQSVKTLSCIQPHRCRLDYQLSSPWVKTALLEIIAPFTHARSDTMSWLAISALSLKVPSSKTKHKSLQDLLFHRVDWSQQSNCGAEIQSNLSRTSISKKLSLITLTVMLFTIWVRYIYKNLHHGTQHIFIEHQLLKTLKST